MSQISAAIAARQTQIAQLQSEIDTLQQAVSIMGGGEEATAQGTSPPRAAAKPKTKPQPKPTGKVKQKTKATQKPQPKKPRAPWSVARRERMKKYWAKRRKAKG